MSGEASYDRQSAGHIDICPRHGGPLDRLDPEGPCWECNMERDEQARDLAESEAVAEYKHRRDWGLLDPPPEKPYYSGGNYGGRDLSSGSQ